VAAARMPIRNERRIANRPIAWTLTNDQPEGRLFRPIATRC
jgi:hypothetical protein